MSEHSLLILWKGSDATLKPAALLSHLDVVPADEDPATSEWTHPPFSGKIEGNYIYGRGAIDLKNNVIAIFHAVEQLLQEGFRPKRSLYVAIGHDEVLDFNQNRGASGIAQRAHCYPPSVLLSYPQEVGGAHGAAKIVERLQSEGVQVGQRSAALLMQKTPLIMPAGQLYGEHLRHLTVGICLYQLEMVLDEGGVIIEDGLPPLTRTPIALVGTAEKVQCFLHRPVFTAASVLTFACRATAHKC